MSTLPVDVETDRQPPTSVPLSHFVVGGCLLVAAGLVGLADALGAAPGRAGLARLHLLLVGWVCVTIMGAMTQFVPVWSGVDLHSRRLATLQLWLVVAGLLGFAAGLLTGWTVLLPVAGLAMVAGVWTFAYNLARTLWTVETFDVTERHFALALGFFVLVTTFGLLLAAGLAAPRVVPLPVARPAVVGAHASLAVFGAVLTTVVGALYQLAPMFTQTDLRGLDVALQRAEAVCYPVGVLVLAAGRLLSSAPLARVGGVLVAGSLLGVGLVLARRLHETRVDRTPMLTRYAVVAAATVAWALAALVAWLRDPLAPAALLGAPGTGWLLVGGVVGFVVLGTLYHVVPFLVWLHQYSDRVGLEQVPTVDDLYSDRLAAADFACFAGGVAALAAGEATRLPAAVATVGEALLLAGAVVFLANVALVVRDHSPDSLAGVLFGRRRSTAGPAETGDATDAGSSGTD